MTSILKVDSLKDSSGSNFYYRNNQFENITIDKSCEISNSILRKNEVIVSHKFTTSPYLNFNLNYRGNSFIPGALLNMGIPSKSNNWYRVRFETIADDRDDVAGGFGFSIYRKVGDNDVERVLSTGNMSYYKNNISDWYVNAFIHVYVPAVNNTDEHIFYVAASGYDETEFRINCDVGDDHRRNNWQNNIMEITEYNGDLVDSGLLTRY
jgi:hypothetical protein